MTRAIALLKSAWADLVGAPSTLSEVQRDQLSMIQFDRLRQRIPILYLVLAMVAVGAALASQGDFPVFLKFATPAMILAASALRYVVWVRRRDLVVDGALARSYLRRVNTLTIVLMGAGSIWAASSFLVTEESSPALVVMFIFVAAFACASSLASLPSAAILSLLLGLAPTALVMFLSGDVRLIALAANVIAVSLLQIRMIVSQFAEMVRNLVLQAELEVQANTDSLTSLLNRRAFGRVLDARVADCRDGEEFLIAMLDLDGFKPVNDRFGHAAGDCLLVMLADRLRAACGPDDHVARIGGDEFAIIFGRAMGSDLIEERIGAIARKLLEPYQIEGQLVFVTASIGTARFPTVATTAIGLLDAADTALYIIKSRGKATQTKELPPSARPSARKAA